MKSWETSEEEWKFNKNKIKKVQIINMKINQEY